MTSCARTGPGAVLCAWSSRRRRTVPWSRATFSTARRWLAVRSFALQRGNRDRADHPGEDRPTTAPAEPRLLRRETARVRPGDLPATQYDRALLQPAQGPPRDRHQIRKDRHLPRSGAHPRIVSALGKIGLKTDSSRPRSDRPVRRCVLAPLASRGCCQHGGWGRIRSDRQGRKVCRQPCVERERGAHRSHIVQNSITLRVSPTAGLRRLGPPAQGCDVQPDSGAISASAARMTHVAGAACDTERCGIAKFRESVWR